MIRRLWPVLAGEPADLVIRSRTGKVNEAYQVARAGHIADRGLLILTVGWLGLRIDSWDRIVRRPEELYEPLTWIGKLVFPTLPSQPVWYALVALALAAVVVSFVRPRWLYPRVLLTLSLLLVITPEFGFGHVQHVNHLFLLGHVYSTFRPMGRPRTDEEAAYRAKGYTWFLLGLLAVYTASGLWKVVDMTIRDVIKPGVTWLEPEALLATSVASMRNVDLSMLVPQYIDAVSWVFPIGYVIIAVLFSASFLAAFRRPLLVIVVPTIMLFHLLNAITLYALFLSTIVVAGVLMLPYEYILSAPKKGLVSVRSSTLDRSESDITYARQYENGDFDRFYGFYACREWLYDRSVLLAAPLYYPGIAWAGTQLLRRKASAVKKEI